MKLAILGTRGIPNHYGGFEQFAQYISKNLVKEDMMLQYIILTIILINLHYGKGSELFIVMILKKLLELLGSLFMI